MSVTNVGVVRRVLEEFGPRAGSRASADAFVAEYFDETADYHPVRKFPDAHPRHGVDEIAAFFAAFAESWETYEFLVVRISAVSDDRVAVHGTIKAHGRGADTHAT